ncbi:MAG: hypothetical protein KH361_04235, partial [Clostridiales bacterium]|nr:hypothetical protein [Clostridiales bacterium]
PRTMMEAIARLRARLRFLMWNSSFIIFPGGGDILPHTGEKPLRTSLCEEAGSHLVTVDICGMDAGTSLTQTDRRIRCLENG